MSLGSASKPLRQGVNPDILLNPSQFGRAWDRCDTESGEDGRGALVLDNVIGRQNRASVGKVASAVIGVKSLIG